LANGDRWSDHAFAAIAGEADVMFDEPRHPVWRRSPGSAH
jgi:hypothetical protein